MNRERIRVAKLGGSLLGLDQLPDRIDSWLRDEPPAKTVVIVGGGPPVEMIRQWAIRQQWPDRQSHWTAIRAMGNNTRRLARLADRWQLATNLVQVHEAGQARLLLDVEPTLRAIQASDQRPLPYSWTVTSDSIAARITRELGSGELVLLKSISSPAGELEQLAGEGIVDGYFPEAADGLHVRIVNLREEFEIRGPSAEGG